MGALLGVDRASGGVGPGVSGKSIRRGAAPPIPGVTCFGGGDVACACSMESRSWAWNRVSPSLDRTSTFTEDADVGLSNAICDISIAACSDVRFPLATRKRCWRVFSHSLCFRRALCSAVYVMISLVISHKCFTRDLFDAELVESLLRLVHIIQYVRLDLCRCIKVVLAQLLSTNQLIL